MILCCKLVEYIESRPVDIKCCLVASRNTAKLWATHGYTHVIAKLSDQTPVLATSKSGPALKPCMPLGYKILMNKKGAMVRDSHSLQSSCKADAALVDHVRLRSCFISPSIPVAPNARFSVPPMHVTGRTRGESNPTVTQLPPGTSASKSTTPPYSVGEVPQNGPFWSDRPRTPYSHFVRKERLKPSLTAGFRNIWYYQLTVNELFDFDSKGIGKKTTGFQTNRFKSSRIIKFPCRSLQLRPKSLYLGPLIPLSWPLRALVPRSPGCHDEDSGRHLKHLQSIDVDSRF